MRKLENATAYLIVVVLSRIKNRNVALVQSLSRALEAVVDLVGGVQPASPCIYQVRRSEHTERDWRLKSIRTSADNDYLVFNLECSGAREPPCGRSGFLETS